MAEKKYLTEKEVAEMTGIAVSTLQSHRFLRKGIPFHKVGRTIRYSLDDVLRYFEERRVQPTEGR